VAAASSADLSPVRLVEQLRAEANAEDAAVLAGYFRTAPGGYAEGDEFIGVKLSRIRALVKAYRLVPFVAADWLPLLRSGVHEDRLAGLVYMTERAVRGPEAEQTLIYSTYLEETEHVNNWDLVDASCGPIVGRYLLDRDRAPLHRLARSGSVWERRIAVVSTHVFLRAGQSADTYRLAENLLGDDHDLIHKAVGWMLREAGKRVDRAELLAFLDAHAAAMPRTMLRYSIEHLDAEQRKHYLDRKHLAR
jgi:3-methyladenine DNA glycosylase AlkD